MLSFRIRWRLKTGCNESFDFFGNYSGYSVFTNLLLKFSHDRLKFCKIFDFFLQEWTPLLKGQKRDHLKQAKATYSGYSFLNCFCYTFVSGKKALLFKKHKLFRAKFVSGKWAFLIEKHKLDVLQTRNLVEKGCEWVLTCTLAPPAPGKLLFSRHIA